MKETNHLEINNDSLVSVDYMKTTKSAYIDNQWTKVNGKTVKIILWYDNEWGYSNIICRLIEHLI